MTKITLNTEKIKKPFNPDTIPADMGLRIHGMKTFQGSEDRYTHYNYPVLKVVIDKPRGSKIDPKPPALYMQENGSSEKIAPTSIGVTKVYRQENRFDLIFEIPKEVQGKQFSLKNHEGTFVQHISFDDKTAVPSVNTIGKPLNPKPDTTMQQSKLSFGAKLMHFWQNGLGD